MRSSEVQRGRKIESEDKRIGDTPFSNKGDEKEQAEKKERVCAQRGSGKKEEKRKGDRW